MARFWVAASLLIWSAISAVHAETLDLTPKDRRIHEAEADLWLDTVFGHCLFLVSGETWSNHPAELQGKWKDMRNDYASNLIKSLYNPKESALPSAIIIDIDPGQNSCWTQYSSIVPSYAGSKLSSIQEAISSEKRLKKARVDQGYGPVLEVPVILVGKNRTPVIFYQSTTVDGPLLNVVTIIKKTQPGFIFYD